MDLVKQNKLIGWVIALLITLNILTLTTLWIIWNREGGAAEVKESGATSIKSASLMQRELELSDVQVNKFQELQNIYLDKSKSVNDELEANKLRIADEIFNPSPDETKVDTMASNIGRLQSQVEVLRFENFRDFAKVLTTEQKEKLRPVLRELYAKKGPKEQQASLLPTLRNDSGSNARIEEKGPAGSDGRPAASSLEEKLDRYTHQLSLTSDQIAKVENILKITRGKEETYKSKYHPNREEFEQEKGKLRNEEDSSVLKELDEQQKKEFQVMIKNRIREKSR
jgi:Spy/CpxP family protein refolding chaperone